MNLITLFRELNDSDPINGSFSGLPFSIDYDTVQFLASDVIGCID